MWRWGSLVTRTVRPSPRESCEAWMSRQGYLLTRKCPCLYKECAAVPFRVISGRKTNKTIFLSLFTYCKRIQLIALLSLTTWYFRSKIKTTWNSAIGRRTHAARIWSKYLLFRFILTQFRKKQFKFRDTYTTMWNEISTKLVWRWQKEFEFNSFV